MEYYIIGLYKVWKKSFITKKSLDCIMNVPNRNKFTINSPYTRGQNAYYELQ